MKYLTKSVVIIILYLVFNVMVDAQETPELIPVQEFDLYGAFDVSADSRYLAVASGTYIYIYDLASGNLLRSFESASETSVVAWSPNGDYLATQIDWSYVAIWNTTSWEMVTKIQGQEDYIEILEWSPDSHYLAIADQSQTIFLWSIDTLSVQEVRSSDGYTGDLHEIEWSPNSQLLAYVGSEGYIDFVPEEPLPDVDTRLHIWNITQNKEILSIPLYMPQVIAWSPDGEFIAAAGGSSQGGPKPPEFVAIHIYEVRTGIEIQTLTDHTEAITDMIWLSNTNQLISVNYGAVRLWDIQPGTFTQVANHAGVLSLNVPYLAVGYFHGQTIEIYDISSGELIFSRGHIQGWLMQIEWIDNGQALISGSLKGNIIVWKFE